MNAIEKMKELDQAIQPLRKELFNQTAKLEKINKDTVFPLWKEVEDRCKELQDQIDRKTIEYEQARATLQLQLF